MVNMASSLGEFTKLLKTSGSTHVFLICRLRPGCCFAGFYIPLSQTVDRSARAIFPFGGCGVGCCGIFIHTLGFVPNLCSGAGSTWRGELLDLGSRPGSLIISQCHLRQITFPSPNTEAFILGNFWLWWLSYW